MTSFAGKDLREAPKAANVDDDTLLVDVDVGGQGCPGETEDRTGVANGQMLVSASMLSAAFEGWSCAADTVSSAEPAEEDGCRDAGAVGERDGEEVGTALGDIDAFGSGFESREEPDLENNPATDHVQGQALSSLSDDTATALEPVEDMKLGPGRETVEGTRQAGTGRREVDIPALPASQARDEEVDDEGSRDIRIAHWGAVVHDVVEGAAVDVADAAAAAAAELLLRRRRALAAARSPLSEEDVRIAERIIITLGNKKRRGRTRAVGRAEVFEQGASETPAVEIKERQGLVLDQRRLLVSQCSVRRDTGRELGLFGSELMLGGRRLLFSPGRFRDSFAPDGRRVARSGPLARANQSNVQGGRGKREDGYVQVEEDRRVANRRIGQLHIIEIFANI
ncbi:hypothetical protein NLG97_g3665 [Lecanicillium saksenae]|uniref:Uncharacterized protein n=1 Tax=Lecanicillium saksenae TaxID=468837 RepID=A0ACC1QY05_9HYPO|nr:hypothetical protein NLG97_g3665 [Lecanicillium saksenae]